MTGFEGSLAALAINYQHVDMYAIADWEGQGTPVGRHAVSIESISKLPHPDLFIIHIRGIYISRVNFSNFQWMLAK